MKYMTHDEWLASRNPQEMLSALGSRESEKAIVLSLRKLRLLAVAALWRAWGVLREEEKRIVEKIDYLAEDSGMLPQDGWRYRQKILAEVMTLPPQSSYRGADWLGAIFYAIGDNYVYSLYAVAHAYASSVSDPYGYVQEQEQSAQADLIRDIFGNPFTPDSVYPNIGRPAVEDGHRHWRAGTVLRMAKQIYASRSFKDLPFLADALEDAGCDSACLLGHLRSAGPHVRGCWALDLVLDKGGPWS